MTPFQILPLVAAKGVGNYRQVEQTFIVGDATTTVVDPLGISAGDSISFQGNINVPAADAVNFTALPPGVSLTFGAGKEITNEWHVGFFGGYTDNESAVDRFGSLLKNEAAYFGVNTQ